MSNSSLQDTSTVLARNIECFEQQRCLIINGPGDTFPQYLSEHGSDTYTFSYHFGYHQLYVQQLTEERAAFGTQIPESWNNFDTIIIYWPKEKALGQLLMQMAMARVANNAAIYCVGLNKGGIKSAPQVAKALELPANKVDAARHCSLFCCPVQSATSVDDNALIMASARVFEVTLNTETIVLVTLAGVFSSGRLDDGTALLLQHLPNNQYDQVLDFGCGCGVITNAIAYLNPKAEVHAVDVNAFALHATQLSLAKNGLKANVYPVTGVQDIQQASLDCIVTNPPFHQGVKTHYQITEQLFSQAPRLLKRHGEMRVVANRFLNYVPLLEASFKQVAVPASTQKFAIYRCTAQPQ
ncbi:class I SAM-dependent methyltransferase [Echinimonas agarilytica]|uniref:Ribosomal RNA small subunit methyltransferase C n=1 Tax=Echinimonas agarilytica TaxID=1215918 RepID=A0AA41WBL4_9GAMM|nr:class I SAM-dependent methyltransferase [Echinimonas agarilytica]MCM2681363.1 class I SAM-dependent methyltransferase [Echinimonas agarilytica]